MASLPRSTFTGSLKWLLVCALTAMLAVVAGCSLGMAYRHADWLIIRQVDHYLDLTEPQKASLGRSLAPMLARHRAQALPLYEGFLSEIRMRVSRGLTREDLDWVFARYDSLRTDLVEQLIGNGAVLLTSVDDQQIEYFEGALRKDREKHDRILRLSKEERLAMRADNTVELVEEWLGQLRPDQKAEIVAISLALPDLRGAWQEHQWQVQQNLLKALRSHAKSDVVALRLREWFLFQDHQISPVYRQAFEAMRTGTKDMVLAIDHMATPQQRVHAIRKLQGFIDTIHDLQVS